RLTPRIVAGDRSAARRLAGSIMIELLAVAIVFGLVASWRFTPPPRSLLAAAQAPLHIHIHGDRAMADLTVTPSVAGRDIVVTVLDGQFGPLRAKDVTLVIARPESGIEPLRLPAGRLDESRWKIDRVQLPVLGDWQLRLEILVSDFDKIVLEDRIVIER